MEKSSFGDQKFSIGSNKLKYGDSRPRSLGVSKLPLQVAAGIYLWWWQHPVSAFIPTHCFPFCVAQISFLLVDKEMWLDLDAPSLVNPL